MIRTIARFFLSRIPQDYFPEWLEARFFTFDEIAARSHASR